MQDLSGDLVLAANDQKILPVEVPEWGGRIHVRSLEGFERDAFEASNRKTKPDGSVEVVLTNFRGRLVALVACDKNGKRLFSDADATKLGKKNGKALDRVVSAALTLNGMKEDSLEEAEKNSVPVLNGASTSD